MVRLGDEFHGGVFAFPCHRASKCQNGVNAVKQIAVPMLFQSSPTAFNGIVLAVIGRIIRQRKRHAGLANKLYQTRQKLSAATMTLRSIVKIEQQRLDLGKPRFVGLPPLTHNIDQTIAGDLGGDAIDTQLVVLGQQHSHGRDLHFGVKVMVGGVDFHPVFARTRVIADLDHCLGIYAEAQHALVGIGLGVGLAELGEDSVGLGNLFFGKLFCTVLRW